MGSIPVFGFERGLLDGTPRFIAHEGKIRLVCKRLRSTGRASRAQGLRGRYGGIGRHIRFRI